MKRIAILFACIASFALTTCENQQVIHILSAPSELDWLNVTAYAGSFPITGGAAMEPSFSSSIFDYTVHVNKDANRFVIDAGIEKEGTVTAMSEKDLITGMDFNFLEDEKAIVVTVRVKHMDACEYRITVLRGDIVPTAKDVEIHVNPGIASFFIGSGVIPEFEVTAVPPAAGIALDYQWYVNDLDNTRTGSPISGTGSTYKMRESETMAERTIYYYVEVTTIVDGKTGITVSPPCRVTFVNKYAVSEKSVAMTDIPAGNIPDTADFYYGYDGTWSTPGFKMGTNLVTWELWETVFKHAEAGNYAFSRKGNQGATRYSNYGSSAADPNNTNIIPRPIGNALNPVTVISWRDVLVWCNAYSEMNGLEPVYRGFDGQPLMDSRDSVEILLDYDAIENAGYNGYRLPTFEEWVYAVRGANPSGEHWDDRLPGTDSRAYGVLGKYLWALSPESVVGGIVQTGEVGKLLPNQLWNGNSYVDGLYDMYGMVWQWIWWPSEQQFFSQAMAIGSDFAEFNGDTQIQTIQYGYQKAMYSMPYSYEAAYFGFRIARNGGN